MSHTYSPRKPLPSTFFCVLSCVEGMTSPTTVRSLVGKGDPQMSLYSTYAVRSLAQQL